MANVEYLLDMRARARRAGDRGIAAACSADLERIGYVDRGPERVTTATGMETAAQQLPERAVPNTKPAPTRQGGRSEKRNKGGRPPLPRCPHDRIVGRCPKCKTAV